MYGHNTIAKDALIGFTTIPIKSLKMGEVNELNITLNQKNGNKIGTLHILLYVAQKGDIPFENKICTPSVFNIKILEGNIKSGNNLYWAGNFENDKDFQFLTTQQKQNKWMEEYQMIYPSKDKIILKLFENKDKESEKGEITLNFQELKDKVPIDKFIMLELKIQFI